MVCPVDDDDSSLSPSSFLKKQKQSVTNQNKLDGNPKISWQAKESTGQQRQNPCHKEFLNLHSKLFTAFLLQSRKPPKPIIVVDKANTIS